jgi:hypothetical protein
VAMATRQTLAPQVPELVLVYGATAVPMGVPMIHPP